MNAPVSADQIATIKASLEHKPQRLFIDGGWADAASGQLIDVVDPATGVIFAQAAAGGAGDIDAAVKAARRAFDSGAWTGLPLAVRRNFMLKLADAIEADVDRLSVLESIDNGMPLMMARFVTAMHGAESLRYNAGWIGKVNGETPTVSAPNTHAYTLKDPVGVVGAITPWNVPFAMAVAKIAAALAAGCTIVLKPAELTPLTAVRLGELIEQVGFPKGVVNIVTGYGDAAGKALVEHPLVDKISFTGSTMVGKSIVAAASRDLKRVTLELGGKSPVIVFADADLDKATDYAAQTIFGNAGQVCAAGSRLYVHKSVFDRVVSGVVDHAKKLKVGSGQEPGVQMGPLVSAKQLDRVAGYVQSGQEEGAEVLVGGDRIGRQGYFMQPTVLAQTQQQMRVVQEEIFGPVLCAMPVGDDDLDRIAAVANDTTYGLSAAIWTKDISVAHLLAKKIKAGVVRINGGTGLDQALPFGGFKQSGWGRENGREGIETYLETKSVTVQL
jgi:acyl-CoA reductase-like NAD-dependent aldehyde dehydrogenase